MKTLNNRITIILLSTLCLSINFNNCSKKAHQQENCPPCSQRAVFGDPAVSEYILPFPAGKSYVLSQSYCNPGGGHQNQLAYDFALPIGAEVIAAREGVVREIREDLKDTGSSINPGDHNHVFIQHIDGTVAFYANLKENGVLMEVGDTVRSGQKIATSGNSGNTLNFSHLHFGVYQGWPAKEGCDVAVNFRNAAGPLDSLGGLITDEFYTAESF